MATVKKSKERAKAPSFPWYPKDWLGDAELRMTSAGTRGIWADLLSYMWMSNDQGCIECTFNQLMKMTGCTDREAALFLVEAIQTNFCDVKFLQDFGSDVTDLSRIAHGDCHANVTDLSRLIQIINRRMYRSSKRKENWRKRQEKRRAKIEDITQVSRKNHGDCHGHVTGQKPSPPFPSSFALKGLSKDKPADAVLPNEILSGKNGSGSKHFSEKVGKYFEDIKSSCEQITKLPPINGEIFNPYMWVQKSCNKGGHPEAIRDTLKNLIGAWSGLTKSPTGWWNTVFPKYNAKYNERDSIRQNEAFKKIWCDSPEIKQLIESTWRE